MAGLTAAARLGQELRRLRQQQGLSQRRLVRELGLSAHSNLVQYELGRRIPPGDIVLACERLLGDRAGTLRRLLAEALAERAGDAPGDAPGDGAGGPAMLPPAVADFTGRAAQLAALTALADPSRAGAAVAVIIPVIAGTAGVGKTALAVNFAHRAADQFPDGQLYLDLRGYAPAPPLTTGQALAALLYALRVPAEQVPADADRAAGLYRSLLAGKRVLVLLDNAASAEQVRPLLPGTAGCLALVTSRDGLGGLIARDGARRLTLDVLTPAEATALLGRIVGVDRVAAEPAATAALAGLCAHLPLALRIAAANLVDAPGQPIADYVTGLRSADPLAGLAVPGDEQGAVRAAFAASYGRLPAPARRLFRLLGLVPGPDVTAAAAAALAGLDLAEAAGLLRRLAGASLLTEPAPGRYSWHDLLRRYAADRADQDEDAAGRAAALGRLHTWYLHGTAAAGRVLSPSTPLLPLPPTGPAEPGNPAEPGGTAGPGGAAEPGGPAGTAEPSRAAGVADPVGAVALPEFGAGPAALAWLEAERANLVAAAERAAVAGPRPLAWLLADQLRGFFSLRLYAADWLATASAGVAAARAAGDGRAEAASRLSLAEAYECQARHQEALAENDAVLAVARARGWVDAQLAALNSLGRVYWQLDRLAEGADHLTQALAIDRATGSLLGQAMRLANLGAMYHEMGRIALSADQFEQALAIARQTGHRRGEAICQANLGMAVAELGRLDDALAHLTPALALARELGDAGNESHALRLLAEVHADAGRDGPAVAAAVAAVAVADAAEDQHFQLETLITLATVRARCGAPVDATAGYRQALELARAADARYPEIVALIGLATVADPPLATDARQALELARRTGYRMLAGHALTAQAAAEQALGQPAPAVRTARTALAVHRETGHRLGAARTLVILGHALHATADPAGGTAAWAEAHDLFRAAGARETAATATLLDTSR